MAEHITPEQIRILEGIQAAGSLTRQEIASLLSVSQEEANDELNSLIIRGAIVGNPIDRDRLHLGTEASFWMSPEAANGACEESCPSCEGVNPCCLPKGHKGECHCRTCGPAQ
ncbi:MAG: helix-turn-helix domain-containing protein [Lentisphaeria bacterium]|nr:helix-turn-helix domain-containing protein [Lentisphaeria bacterium]